MEPIILIQNILLPSGTGSGNPSQLNKQGSGEAEKTMKTDGKPGVKKTISTDSLSTWDCNCILVLKADCLCEIRD